jgi:DNA-binding SARP family transcriptional activator
MNGSVRIGVLGSLSVEIGASERDAPGAEVVRGLLGVLLLAGREPMSVERLISVVWDDRAGHTRPASVHVAVTRLRGWLDEAGLAAEVRREGGGYRLVHDFDLDLDRLVEPGTPEEPAAARRERLAAALGRYRGPVLADVVRLGRSDPLVLGAERLVLRRCLELADVAEATGRPAAGVSPLETYASCDPYEEMVQARLVELLTAAGRPAAAWQRYEQARALLAAELGVAPCPRLRRAGHAAAGIPVPRAGSPAAGLPVPGGQVPHRAPRAAVTRLPRRVPAAS